MMIELRSEDDIWRLFGGEDHNQPGKWQQSFLSVERHLLDTDGFHKHRPDVPAPSEVAKAKKKIKQRFPLKDTERLYLLTARGREVCVDQSRLLRVGKVMKDRDLSVQYLGSARGGR